jgi:hypothetical protein
LVGLILLAGASYWYFFRSETAPQGAAKSAPKPRSSTPESVPDYLFDSGPSTGSLEVTANVEGADVYLDGEAVGETPFRLDEIEAGPHEIRVEIPGRQPFRKSIRIAGGQESRVRAFLKTELARLRVESDIAGATVFVDRRYVGTTPLTVEDFGPGNYELTVSAEGYDIHSEMVELAPGSRDLFVRFKEVTLRESAQVVHKHSFGSCEGRLVATPEGIRYETAHKDSFVVPFASLERFEVDYEKKNLQVKVRGGRKYNFTEKSGNADALFIFHQKVEAARKRLADD